MIALGHTCILKTSVRRAVDLIRKVRVGCQWDTGQNPILDFVFPGVENTHFQAEGDSWWLGGFPAFCGGMGEGHLLVWD